MNSGPMLRFPYSDQPADVVQIVYGERVISDPRDWAAPGPSSVTYYTRSHGVFYFVPGRHGHGHGDRRFSFCVMCMYVCVFTEHALPVV